MPFTDLTLNTLDDKPGFFEIDDDVTYVWYDYEDGKLINKNDYVVPKGFITDLASIPALMRIFFSRVGKSRKPAVFHDHMYGVKWKTRKRCDKMFRQMLLERDMNRFSAWSYYRAVRAFGWTRGKW